MSQKERPGGPNKTVKPTHVIDLVLPSVSKLYEMGFCCFRAARVLLKQPTQTRSQSLSTCPQEPKPRQCPLIYSYPPGRGWGEKGSLSFCLFCGSKKLTYRKTNPCLTSQWSKSVMGSCHSESSGIERSFHRKLRGTRIQV